MLAGVGHSRPWAPSLGPGVALSPSRARALPRPRIPARVQPSAAPRSSPRTQSAPSPSTRSARAESPSARAGIPRALARSRAPALPRSQHAHANTGTSMHQRRDGARSQNTPCSPSKSLACVPYLSNPSGIPAHAPALPGCHPPCTPARQRTSTARAGMPAPCCNSPAMLPLSHHACMHNPAHV